MYQGVITQCCGVAHNSRFSDFSQSVESFLFTFQYLCLWGIISIPILMPCTYGAPFHPNSRATWGIYHPIYLLLCTRHLPSHTFSNGAFILPILGCFSLHITSPITKGCINSHRAPFHPISSFHNFSGLMGHLSFP